jgi:hypothetical protein
MSILVHTKSEKWQGAGILEESVEPPQILARRFAAGLSHSGPTVHPWPGRRHLVLTGLIAMIVVAGGRKQ